MNKHCTFYKTKKIQLIWDKINFVKNSDATVWNQKIYKVNFKGILKYLFKIYILLHFRINLIQIFWKSTFQYYNQLVESRFKKYGNEKKYDQNLINLILRNYFFPKIKIYYLQVV